MWFSQTLFSCSVFLPRSTSIRSLIAARVEGKKYTLKARRDQTSVMASWSMVKRRPKFTVLQAQYLAFIQT
jgi:hypothetical protein